MTAAQRFRLILRVIVVELTVANRAHSLILLCTRIIYIRVQLFDFWIKFEADFKSELVLVFEPG